MHLLEHFEFGMIFECFDGEWSTDVSLRLAEERYNIAMSTNIIDALYNKDTNHQSRIFLQDLRINNTLHGLYTLSMPKKIQALGKAETRLKELRARITKAPQTPGVYRWIGDNGDVLYVGKAKNLKNRLKSYVQKKPDLSIGPWKLALLQKITDVDWTVTETEIEALMLETNLIKELKPKYNVLMKDDKNYVYVRMSMKDAYPTVSIIRRMEEDGAKYFGPFMSAHHIHRTLDMLHDVYGWRACKRSLDLLNKQPLSSPARRPVPRSPKGEVGKRESIYLNFNKKSIEIIDKTFNY